MAYVESKQENRIRRKSGCCNMFSREAGKEAKNTTATGDEAQGMEVLVSTSS
jgi:hypothetical protein